MAFRLRGARAVAAFFREAINTQGSAAFTIAGIELSHRLRNEQFTPGGLCLKGKITPRVWNGVLAA